MRLSRETRLALLLITAAGLFYGVRLTAWRAGPDEGTYLYQAWRISLGEFPYRDFLTPQLPVFLGLGGVLFRLVGPSLLAIRLLTLVAMLGAGTLVYVWGTQLMSPRVALLGLVLFLTHDGVYELAREYRPEAYMLVFSTAGLVVMSRWWITEGRKQTAESKRQRANTKIPDCLLSTTYRSLAFAGVLFGLAMMSKLFGLLPFIGAGLFVVYLGLSHRLTRRQMVGAGLWLCIPFMLVVAVIVGGALIQAPNFFDAILFHHLRQGSNLPRVQVVAKAFELYWTFFTNYPVLVVLAFLGMWLAWWRELGARQPESISRIQTQSLLQLPHPYWPLLAWQLPTALAFVMLSRDLRVRHLIYLLPVLCLLAGLAMYELGFRTGMQALDGQTRGHGNLKVALQTFVRLYILKSGVGLLLLSTVIIPPMAENLVAFQRSDPGTPALAEYIQQNTAPDSLVVGDYAAINFYARRKTVFSGASLSTGATMSGQINGRELIREMSQAPVEMVLMRSPAGFFVLMRDYLDFRRYVQTHFRFDRTFERTGQMHRLYRTGSPELQLHPVRFSDQLTLVGSTLEETQVESGGLIYLVLGWQAQRALTRDYAVFIHLADERGHLWAIRDQELRDESGRPPTEWVPDTRHLDAYAVQVMPGTPPGRYQLRVGVYPRDEPGHPLGGRDLLPLGEGRGESWTGTEYTLGPIEIVKAVTPWWVFAPSPIKSPLEPEAVFNKQVALVGFSGAAESIRPGDALHITAFWRTLEPVAGSYHARFEVRDARGDIWLAGHPTLTSDTYPTEAWTVRDIVAGQYDLVIPGGAAQGQATLQVSVTDAEGQPLAGSPVALFDFDIQAIARRFDVPPIQHPLSVTLSDQLELLGYNLPETCILAGTQIPLTLVWRGRKPIETSYKVFTHLLDSQDKIWGQQDNVPVMGTRPTTGWAPGEVILDEYSILVAPDAPTGTYSLEVGLYDPATGRRLELYDASQAPLGDRLRLQEITVDRR